MLYRGDVIIFRPIFVTKNDQDKEFGSLKVGIVLKVQTQINLEGPGADERRQDLLSIRISGEYSVGQQYPDKLDEQLCEQLDSVSWHQVRRETFLNDDSYQQTDGYSNDMKPYSSNISDLDILIASQNFVTDKSSIERLDIRGMIADYSNIYRPSMFHSTITKAKETATMYRDLTTLLGTMIEWKNYISYQKMKADAIIILQKNIRYFLGKESREKQKLNMIKWWHCQKRFWHFYINPKDVGESTCYNVRGTNIYLDSKLLADQWNAEMRKAINAILFHFWKNISHCLKKALKKWKFALSIQKENMALMFHEDFLSSSIYHDECNQYYSNSSISSTHGSMVGAFTMELS